ncbi:phosphoadenylyl-sulfate reductase [Planktotalea sp.]|uniref:phosphoadenylyl-sulfate reductase n=1 Tax=Planktotalea sp. TaxID=2029877 RepID=UPI003D6BB55B
MPREDIANDLGRKHRVSEAKAAIELSQSEPEVGRIALVSSFGADSAVLLHLAARVSQDIPVLFLDTGKHFEETLSYQRDLAVQLGLRDLRVIKPDAQNLREQDPYGALHTHAPDACCDLRKTQPLHEALTGFDGWITGRKRHQSQSRAALKVFESDAASGRLKINPLAHWSMADIADYMRTNALLAHPLIARGFLSIGCAPCTSATAQGEDPRSGRWRGTDKAECGIHFNDKAHQRATTTQGTAT